MENTQFFFLPFLWVGIERWSKYTLCRTALSREGPGIPHTCYDSCYQPTDTSRLYLSCIAIVQGLGLSYSNMCDYIIIKEYSVIAQRALWFSHSKESRILRRLHVARSIMEGDAYGTNPTCTPLRRKTSLSVKIAVTPALRSIKKLLSPSA